MPVSNDSNPMAPRRLVAKGMVIAPTAALCSVGGLIFDMDRPQAGEIMLCHRP